MEQQTGSKQKEEDVKVVLDVNAEYIMRNAGMEEAEAGVQIARININNLRYADNTTLMAKNEEEL